MRAMSRRGGRRLASIGLTIGLTIGLLAPPAGALAAPVAQAEDLTPGLRIEEAVTYTVDLSAAVVHVTHVVTLTNETPDEVSGGWITEFFFPEYAVAVPPSATNLAARRDGHGRLGVRLEPAEGSFATAVVDLVPDLRYGRTQTVQVTYDLLPQPPRSGALAQVNQAFATFPVYTTADPGLATVTVSVPVGLSVDVVGSTMQSTVADGRLVYTASAIADPAQWWAMVVVRDDDALVGRLVFFDDIGVHVQAWPGDTEWLDFTADLVERGLPALEAAIGRPWLVHGQLEVVETSAPYVYGYGGWYRHDRSLIEVGDDLDPHVTLHEMAHAWFNAEALDSRWLTEGLANEYAALAMAELGLERPEPSDLPEQGRVPLNAWADFDLDDPETPEREAYGYAASWWLVHALVAELGPDGVSDVVQAAIERVSPYPGAGTGALTRVPDWRTALDLFEEAGSTTAEQHFRDLVVTPEEAALLDARAAARAEYAELVEAGRGWAPPAVVRRAMTDWEFDAATAAMPAAAEAFARRDAVAERLAAIGEELSDEVREDVEAAGDVTTLRGVVTALGEAADAVVEGTTAVRDANVLARLGMLVLDADEEAERARAALARADYDAAERAGRAAADGVGTATAAGGGAIGVVLLAGGLLVVLRLRQRGRRRPPEGEAPAEQPTVQPAIR